MWRVAAAFALSTGYSDDSLTRVKVSLPSIYNSLLDCLVIRFQLSVHFGSPVSLIATIPRRLHALEEHIPSDL